jgi:Cd2+/Zn2+-exporting ATPase
VAAILLQGRVMDGIDIGMYLVAMAISGYSTFIKGVKNLIRFKFNIDTLMTIALIGAIGIQQWKKQH